MPVFHGYASQYGHGLGNVLGGIVRSALPIVRKIAKSAGSQLLKSGMSYVSKQLTKRPKPKRSRRKRNLSISRPIKLYKRKIPPGQPFRNLTKRRKSVLKGRSGVRDIFSS